MHYRRCTNALALVSSILYTPDYPLYSGGLLSPHTWAKEMMLAGSQPTGGTGTRVASGPDPAIFAPVAGRSLQE